MTGLPKGFQRMRSFQDLEPYRGNPIVQKIIAMYVSTKSDEDVELVWLDSERKLERLIGMDEAENILSWALKKSGYTRAMMMKNTILVSGARKGINDRTRDCEETLRAVIKSEVGEISEERLNKTVSLLSHPNFYECDPHIFTNGSDDDIVFATERRKGIIKAQDSLLNYFRHSPMVKKTFDRMQMLNRISEKQELREKYDVELVNRMSLRICDHVVHYTFEKAINCSEFAKYITPMESKQSILENFIHKAKKIARATYNLIDDNLHPLYDIKISFDSSHTAKA